MCIGSKGCPTLLPLHLVKEKYLWVETSADSKIYSGRSVVRDPFSRGLSHGEVNGSRKLMVYGNHAFGMAMFQKTMDPEAQRHALMDDGDSC